MGNITYVPMTLPHIGAGAGQEAAYTVYYRREVQPGVLGPKSIIGAVRVLHHGACDTWEAWRNKSFLGSYSTREGAAAAVFDAWEAARGDEVNN